MKKLALLLLLLGACAGEDARSYREWVGVYRVDAFRSDEACDPGGEPSDPPASHLLVDARLFPEDAIVRGIRCADAATCDEGTHFEIVAPPPTTERLAGSGGEYRFSPISANEGSCTLQIARVEMTRDGDAVALTIHRLDRRDVRVESEEACLELVDTLTDEDCARLEEYELTKVE